MALIPPWHPSLVVEVPWIELSLYLCRQQTLPAAGAGQPPTVQPWGTFAKFKDADGNQFVLSGK